MMTRLVAILLLGIIVPLISGECRIKTRPNGLFIKVPSIDAKDQRVKEVVWKVNACDPAKSRFRFTEGDDNSPGVYIDFDVVDDEEYDDDRKITATVSVIGSAGSKPNQIYSDVVAWDDCLEDASFWLRLTRRGKLRFGEGSDPSKKSTRFFQRYIEGRIPKLATVYVSTKRGDPGYFDFKGNCSVPDPTSCKGEYLTSMSVEGRVYGEIEGLKLDAPAIGITFSVKSCKNVLLKLYGTTASFTVKIGYEIKGRIATQMQYRTQSGRKKTLKPVYTTPLSCKEFRKFWLTYNREAGIMTVGSGTELDAGEITRMQLPGNDRNHTIHSVVVSAPSSKVEAVFNQACEI